MNSPANDQTSSTDPEEIEEDIAKHRAELGATVEELSERLNLKKQAKRRWDQVRKYAENNGAVAADQAKLAWVRARHATPGTQAAILSAALALIGGIVLITVLIRRKKP